MSPLRLGYLWSNLFLVAMAGLASGCETLTTKVENDPMTHELTGPEVFIDVFDSKNNSIKDSIFGRTIQDETANWAAEKGFKVTNTRHEANNALIFAIDEKQSDVYIPAQTSSLPIFDGNGNQTGSTTNYHEGYSTQVKDRWLFIQIFRLPKESKPERITQGQVFPTKRDQEFFENPDIVRNAVRKLLDSSALANLPQSKIPEINPGCHPRTGIIFDVQILKEQQQGVIKDFIPQSNAPEAGLKVGDTVISIDGVASPSETVKMEIGKPASVIIRRDKKTSTFMVMPVNWCIPD